MLEQGIPKIIHYCWFGRNPKPKEALRCIDSWKEKLSSYEIMEWNEDSIKMENMCPYVKEAYNNKKWAFVSDYVRLVALYQYGGIYFDTDVEVFKGFDQFLDAELFAGFESKDYIATAVIGARKESPIIQQFMRSYNNRHFVLEDETLDTDNTNVVAFTKLLASYGVKVNGNRQSIDGIDIYEQKVFSSNDLINVFGKYAKGAYAYHHCAASWYDKPMNGLAKRIKRYIIGVMRNSLGTHVVYRMGKVAKKVNFGGGANEK